MKICRILYNLLSMSQQIMYHLNHYTRSHPTSIRTSTANSQDSLQEPEVQFPSMVEPALEKEWNVSDKKSITDCQRNKGQPDGNCKWPWHLHWNQKSKNNSKYNKYNKYKYRSSSCCQSCYSETAILTMTLCLNQNLELCVVTIYQKNIAIPWSNFNPHGSLFGWSRNLCFPQFLAKTFESKSISFIFLVLCSTICTSWNHSSVWH